MEVKKGKKKQSKVTIGIDPGQKGAIAIIKKGKLLKYFMMPLIGGKIIDLHAIDDILKKYEGRIEHVWMEDVHAMPQQGVVSMFNFGKGFGFIQGLVVGNRIPYTLVRPQDWKKVMLKGVGVVHKTKKKDKKAQVKVLDDKARSIIAAKRLCPKESFIPKGCRTPKDGPAEAALIGLYGYGQHYKNKERN